jgi:hypothetical protein
MKKPPITVKQFASAVASSCIVFLLVRTALHSHAGMLDPIDGVADYLTIGITILCFAVILHRLRLATWTREQEDELLSVDDRID